MIVMKTACVPRVFYMLLFNIDFTANMAMAALIAADLGIMKTELRHWAMCQIHYAIGDTGFSFVIGFGSKYPHSPHHRSRCDV